MIDATNIMTNDGFMICPLDVKKIFLILTRSYQYLLKERITPCSYIYFQDELTARRQSGINIDKRWIIQYFIQFSVFLRFITGHTYREYLWYKLDPIFCNYKQILLTIYLQVWFNCVTVQNAALFTVTLTAGNAEWSPAEWAPILTAGNVGWSLNNCDGCRWTFWLCGFW